MKQKLAIFDVDGTLFDGNLGIEYLKSLIVAKVFSDEIGAKIMEWYGKYKSGEVDKVIVVDEIYKLWAFGFIGINTEVAEKIAMETYEKVKTKLFSTSILITNKIQEKGYVPILLSGSPIEMIRILGKDLGMISALAIGGELEIISGRYTGKIVNYPGSAEQKVSILNDKLKKLNIDVDWENSIAMGDNERDLKILKMVGKPIAFKPNIELKNVAIQNSWNIADEVNILDIVNKFIN